MPHGSFDPSELRALELIVVVESGTMLPMMDDFANPLMSLCRWPYMLAGETL